MGERSILAIKQLGGDKLQIVVPTVSMLAEPPVAVVDKVVLRRGTREVAAAYLQYLYSKEGQEIVARNYYRPRDPEIAAKYAARYPKLNLATIADFGGWAKAQPEHFSEGGVFDQIYAPLDLPKRHLRFRSLRHFLGGRQACFSAFNSWPRRGSRSVAH